MKLSLAMLYVVDIDRMSDFYGNALGLPPLPAASSPGWSVFDADGTQFALHQIPPQYAADIVLTQPATERSETPYKLIFQTAEALDAVCARLEAAGAVLLAERMPNSRDMLDPEGNVLQIARA